MSSFNKTTAPEIEEIVGSNHPINQIKDFILDILDDLGFSQAYGPEIETERFNFDMLNIKETHPARQMHDTFYVQNKSFVLRTHTSPVQIRTMLESKPPIAISSPGKVYRKDDDSTHLPMFHQIEGIYIDKDKIIYLIFDKSVEIRFRPSYFPFTEPSAEVDIRMDDSSWLEILGCGIVNPIVLENCNINPDKYSGLAFGLGIERIAMLKYGVDDIREFYKSNLDFLNQFK